jgi:hypothetical protein
MTAENALLFAVCRARANTTFTPDAQLDWDYLVSAADRQGIAPLLHDWLTRLPASGVPESAARRLQELYWATHFLNRDLLNELDRVLEAASAAAIDVLPLKGAVLAPAYYPTPALRPMSDLDLLVRPHDLDRMAALLQSLGYLQVDALPSYAADDHLDRASREHIWIVSRPEMTALIEFRGEALQSAMARLSDLDASLAARLREHAAAIWSRADREADAAARWRMSREDLLLHVAAHLAAQHAEFRLIWLHDIVRVLAREAGPIDWEYIAANAVGLRIGGPVWAALDAAVRWVDAPIPQTALDDLLRRSQPSGVLRRWEFNRLATHAARLGDADFTRAAFAVWPFGAAISRMQGWIPRLKALRWAVLPSRVYMERYGAPVGGPMAYVRAWTRRVTRAIGRRLWRRR